MRIATRLPMLAAVVLSLAVGGAGRGQEPDEDSGEPRLVVQTGYSSWVNAVAYSPDGRRILTGARDATRLWDAETGKELLTLQSAADAVAFSRDGKQFLTGLRQQVRLWDAETGKELRSFKGHANAMALSPDGQRLVTADSAGVEVHVWDANSGKSVLAFKVGREGVPSATFSPDGKRILTGGRQTTARLWDAETGKELRAFPGPKDGSRKVAVSPDGQRVVTAGGATVQLWDAETGKVLQSLKGAKGVNSVAFSPDGRRVLAGGGGAARLWDAETGKEQSSLKGNKLSVTSAAFSPDGKYIVTGSAKATAQVWDAATGKELRALKTPGQAHQVVAFSPDGTRILNCSNVAAPRLWDAEIGKELFTLHGHTRHITSAAFSPDGRLVVTGSADQTARLWEVATGKELRVLTGHKQAVTAVAFSPDGKHLVTDGDQTARLWEVATGKELPALRGRKHRMTAAAFSPNGKRLLTAGQDHPRVWNVETEEEQLALKGHEGRVTAVGFSPDGTRLLTADGPKVRLWDAKTGKVQLTLRHKGGVTAAAFSSDGERVLAGGTGPEAQVWNATTGKELLTLKGHFGGVTSVAFSRDNRFILTGSQDTLGRLWGAKTGKELCRLVSFRNGGWAVVDSAGRYDSSNGGDVEGLHWVIDQEVVALSQLKDRYYEPGLLAKYLGFNKEPLRDVKAVLGAKLYPEVAVAQPDLAKPVMDVALTNQGGGIGRVVVLVNGKEKTADARAAGADAGAASLDLTIDLSGDPRLVPGRKNTVEVLAYNADGSLSSRGLVREFDGPGPAAADPPALYAVVVGIAEYKGAKLNLRFAAKDAEDFAAALKLAAGRFLDPDKGHPDRVRVTLLTAASGEASPSRANLVKALEALKASKPGDIVVVYLAGHGVTHGGPEGDWYYLTADAQSGDLTDAAVRQQVSLSSAELTDLLKASPAGKQVLVLDTCHSGRVVEQFAAKRDVPGSQVRALERVKDRTGMHVLAGCAADSVSYEATRYGQGLLTYSLLQGMRGARLRDGEFVDVVDLFGFAADRVPELARDIGGVQRPVVASPRGGSFDIGRLTAEDRAKVPLQADKPVVLRANFQLEKPARDSLELSDKVNELLRAASAVARGAKLAFVDADKYPGGVQPAGRYKIDGDKVTVNGNLFQGDKDLGEFKVEGAAGKPDELARKIVAEVEKKLAAPGGK